MTVEIKVRNKHIAGKGIYGYRRQHNGNNNKKQKRIGSNVHGDPYNREEHVKALMPNMKMKMYHYGDVHHVGLYATAIRASMELQRKMKGRA
jgi:hypothetical protein